MAAARNGKSEGGVQSLDRAFGLLARLGEAGVGLSLSDLAGANGLAPSTAHRLLNSMRAQGFVAFDEAAGLWSVGLAAFSVGQAYLKKRDFVAEARPFMKQLVAETGETSNLAVRDGDHHVFLAQVECQQMMRMVTALGRPGPLHASGVGKVLLSTLDAGECQSLLRRTGLPSFTTHTVTTPSALNAELARVRERGYAIDDEEQALGMVCLAAPIRDEYADVIGALSISGPRVRLGEPQWPALSAAVMQAADRITTAIGGVHLAY